MQGFEALSELLEGFVERELDGALVLECEDAEVALVARALADLDERDGADVFQVFGAAVAGTIAGYVDGLVVTLEAQLAAIDERLAAEGTARWPGLPPGCRVGTPCARVLALIEWVRARMPAGDHRLVWALLPGEIVDRAGWAGLCEALLAAPMPAGVRLVLRDDAAAPRCARAAEAWPDARVLAYRPGLTPASLVEAVAEVADDPQQPPRQRVLAALQLAYLDLGHGRLDQARGSFTAIAGFFAATGEPGLQALALGGAADALGRAGEAAASRVEFERALVLATRAGAWAVALNLAIALAGACAERGQWADAESYHGVAAGTAARLGNRHALADALEQIGALRAVQGDAAAATAAWREAATICCEIDYGERLVAVLGRLAPVHRAAGREAEARACEATAAQLREEAA